MKANLDFLFLPSISPAWIMACVLVAWLIGLYMGDRDARHQRLNGILRDVSILITWISEQNTRRWKRKEKRRRARARCRCPLKIFDPQRVELPDPNDHPPRKR